MLNTITVVGRLVNEPTIRTNENGKKVSEITLSVPRSYKNINGEYENDYIDCLLWQSIAENTTEYCRAGDIIGVKGRLQKGENDNSMVVVAEKVSYLAPARKEEE